MPFREVGGDGGFEAFIPAGPIVTGFWRTVGGLGDADEQAQDGNAFVRRDGEVGDLRCVREKLVKADGGGAAVEPADGNPRVGGEVESGHLGKFDGGYGAV